MATLQIAITGDALPTLSAATGAINKNEAVSAPAAKTPRPNGSPTRSVAVVRGAPGGAQRTTATAPTRGYAVGRLVLTNRLHLE